MVLAQWKLTREEAGGQGGFLGRGAGEKDVGYIFFSPYRPITSSSHHPCPLLNQGQALVINLTAPPFFAHNLRLEENMTGDRHQVIFCQISHCRVNIRALGAGM